MSIAIFCPSSHLILSASRCPVCGWERPSAAEIGELAWPPVTLKAGSGGPGRHVFAQAAATQSVAAFPLNNRQIVGLNLDDGVERWLTTLPEGLVTRALVAEGKRLLLTLSDERQIGLAGPGQLASLDPASGQLTTLWQADGHQLTIPVLTEKHLLVRNSTSGLVAFKRGPKLEIAWKVSLNTWWALPPFVTQGKVFVCDGLAMQGEGWLKALDLSAEGREVWSKRTEGLLAQPLTACDGKLVFQNGKRQILALNADTGAEAWKLNFEQLYTPPVSGGGRVFFVARGGAPKGSPGYYLLKAVAPATGQVEWETPLPARVLIPLLWDQGRLYLSTEDGLLLAFNDQNGDQLFSQPVGGEEDPPRTELLVAEGILLVGTYSGRVIALRVEAAQRELESPKSLLEKGEFESAAEVFALRGELKKAAEIYAERLHEIPKALQIYEHAGLYQDAAQLAESQGLLAEAERFYALAGDQVNQAEMLLKRGDELGAARLFEQIGQLAKAAGLYEQTGEFIRARELYQKLGDENSESRIFNAMPPSSERVEFLIKRGKLAEAADMALTVGLLRQAVDLFKQAGLEGRELDTLLQLQEKEPEAWLYERIAELGRKTGRYLDEAGAWEQLGHPRQAAEAYCQAARQAEQAPVPNPPLVGKLYQRARDSFAGLGLKSMERECEQKIIQFLALPSIMIESLSPKKDFIEGEFNRLELVIRNLGYGVAVDILVQVVGDRFETSDTTSMLKIGNLADGEIDKKSILIRPKTGQVGETVPLRLEWRWQDRAGTHYRGGVDAEVPVRRKDETHPNSTPHIINIGTLIGEQVQGDKLGSGASKQVGDRVEIHRGEGLKSSTSDIQKCPKCGMTNEADAKFCVRCQEKLV